MLENFDKNKNPFKVPENYFENFNSSIMEKLPEKESKKAKIVPLWKKVLPWTAAAAIFCGVIFTTGILDKGTASDPVITNGLTSSSLEEDYYLFVEDEVAKSQYKEMMYSNY